MVVWLVCAVADALRRSSPGSPRSSRRSSERTGPGASVGRHPAHLYRLVHSGVSSLRRRIRRVIHAFCRQPKYSTNRQEAEEHMRGRRTDRPASIRGTCAVRELVRSPLATTTHVDEPNGGALHDDSLSDRFVREMIKSAGVPCLKRWIIGQRCAAHAMGCRRPPAHLGARVGAALGARDRRCRVAARIGDLRIWDGPEDDRALLPVSVCAWSPRGLWASRAACGQVSSTSRGSSPRSLCCGPPGGRAGRGSDTSCTWSWKAASTSAAWASRRPGRAMSGRSSRLRPRRRPRARRSGRRHPGSSRSSRTRGTRRVPE